MVTPPIYTNYEVMRKIQFFTIFAHTRRIGAAAQKSEASPQQNSEPVLNFLDFFAKTPEDKCTVHIEKLLTI